MPIRVKGQTSDRHPRREWNSPERRKKRQEEYMEKHGPQEPRRKRLATEDKYKEVREKLKDRGGFKPLRAAKAKGGKAGTGPSPGTRIKARKARAAEWWTGREGTQAVYNPTLDKKLREKRPHSSPEGRMRDVKTAYAKAAAEHKKIKDSGIKRKWGKPKQYGGRPASPNRAKKGIGGAITKIISKIKPKPKGVFKPKPVPKAVTDVDRPFKGYDKSYTKADDKKMDALLKKLGDEIKAAPLPPKLKATLKKAQKAFPHKKASGGRIGLKHGGSVGAAVRGHGAEIK